LKEFCANARPEVTAENVAELLAVADLHGADPLKTHALANIKRNAAATDDCAELVTNPGLLVNDVATSTSKPDCSFVLIWVLIFLIFFLGITILLMKALTTYVE
jgi:hypothetical protein